MAQVIVSLNEISSAPLNDVMKYSDAKTNSNQKGKNVSVHFQHAGELIRLVTQTPKMWCQFGLDEFVPEDGGQSKYSLRLAFKNLSNPGMQELHTLLKRIDQQNIDQAMANQATWWPSAQVKSRDILEDRYTPIVRSDPNGKYEDQMRVKLDYKNGMYEGLVFDDSSPVQQVDTGYIEPRCHVIVLLEFGPIWIADKSFGQTVRAVQIKCFKQRSIRSYAITHTDAEMDEGNYEEYVDEE